MKNLRRKNPKRIHLKILFVGSFLLLQHVQACSSEDSRERKGQDEDEQQVDLSEKLFDPDHLIEVEIEMDPDDWDLIRMQGRQFTDVMTGCPPDFEYTYVDSTVTVDGEKYENVAVRKKGFLGSLSQIKPSLKVNFGRNADGQTAWDMKRMTLNNDRQDPSHTHQCMSYQLFRAAGVVAPRCNFAHVTVNGQDLGIYSNVESIRKPFLARHFDDNDGNLYEARAPNGLKRK